MTESVPNNYLPKPFQGLTNTALLQRWPHSFRFRDPDFVKIWRRWQAARAAWETAWWQCPMGTLRHFRDEDCPDHPAAREFVAARRAYLDDLTRRSKEESANG